MPRGIEPVAIAIMAKAPVPGLAKTRLIPELGAHGAAVLQERLIERAVETAIAAAIGPVTLWVTPDATHVLFRELVARFALTIKRQPEGDLGARMLAALAAANGPALVIGSDCPALDAGRLRAAAEALQAADIVLVPVEDGGYCLIGARKPLPEIFSAMPWSTPRVMQETRARLVALGVNFRELPPLWDVDRPADLERLQAPEFSALLA